MPLAILLAGCGHGRRPIIQAQFCLTAANGPYQLKNVFQKIARDEGLDYFERGSPSDALMTPGGKNKTVSSSGAAEGFEMAVRSADDELGFDASVSGSPANQVMM